MSQKALALIFDVDFLAYFKEGEVRDGKFLLKEKGVYKEWILGIPQRYTDENGKERVRMVDVKPFTVKGRFGGTKPLYILKWNSLYPLAYKVKTEKKFFLSPDTGEEMTTMMETLETIVPDFKDTKVLPELLGDTHDLRFMKGMKKYVTEGDSNMKGILMFVAILMVLIGVGFGIYYLFFRGKQGG